MAIKHGLRFQGVDNIKKAFKDLRDNTGKIGADSVMLIAKDVMRLARHRAPLDVSPTADDIVLRDSGFISEPKLTRFNDQVDIDIGFTVPYAWIQHENEAYHHAVGESKYLVSAVNDVALKKKNWKNTLRGHIWEVLRRLGRR